MVEFYKEKLTFYRLLLTLVITADTGCMALVIYTIYELYHAADLDKFGCNNLP